ncbi:MAG TPA: FGGY-family carbohydrate kinase [Clostridia bacterium]|jgi:xylulokinase|nr:FGGY-family carbohydrate kinase [Clostridia bacterium]HQC68839.1 FGGY-family carbohydrate kinase [Clostridia bacterium]
MISLGIDIGGTGCKCVAFRDDGKQLAVAYTEYPLAAGQVNLPSDILTLSVFQVIKKCTAEIPDKQQIAAITVCSFGESFVPVDKDGNALTDILLYFSNTESEEFNNLVSSIGEEKFMRIARILPDASYSLSKMLYTRKVAKRPVWKYLFIANFITYRLTGKAYTDVSLACRSLLYDVENRCWSKQLLELCSIEESTLPEVLPAGVKAGTILPKAAALLGLPCNVQVVTGCHDQIVNALGAGVRNAGDAVDSSGTSECITPLFSSIPESLDFQRNNFACVPYLEDRGYVTYAYNISAGSVVRWYRDALASHMSREAAMENKSIYDLLNEQCPSQPSDLMMLPFLQGMGGTPDVDATATGLIAGLTTQTRLTDIYRAVLEGITFEMRYNREKLGESGVTFKKLFACGGGARSSVWLQIKADILGCEIIPVKSEETGAMGCAILGICAITGEKPFDVAERFWQYGTHVRPNPEHLEIYNKKYKTYKTLRKLYMKQRSK